MRRGEKGGRAGGGAVGGLGKIVTNPFSRDINVVCVKKLGSK
jgi:hypothetical protein